jgi:hypothetical protein
MGHSYGQTVVMRRYDCYNGSTEKPGCQNVAQPRARLFEILSLAPRVVNQPAPARAELGNTMQLSVFSVGCVGLRRTLLALLAPFSVRARLCEVQLC